MTTVLDNIKLIIIKEFVKIVITFILAYYIVCYLINAITPDSSKITVSPIFSALINIIHGNRGYLDKEINYGIIETLLIVSISIIISSILSYVLGYYSSLYKRSTFIKIIRGIVYSLSALPVFIISIFVRPYWSYNFDTGELNKSFLICLGYYIIPIIVLCLGDGTIGEMTKYINEEIDGITNENYFKAIKSRNGKLFKHVFKNSLLFLISLIFSKFIYLLGGAIVIEYIFFSQGIGVTLLNAIKYREIDIILKIVFIFLAIVFVINVLKCLIYIIYYPKATERQY